MCDYSLMHLKSRAAKKGDKLITGRLTDPETGHQSLTRGLYSKTDCTTAVCILPGTEVAFAEKPIKFLGILPYKKPTKVATFTQVNQDNHYMHHDALRFADGEVRLINDLEDGQRMTVLSLPAKPRTEKEAAEQKRLEVVA